MASSIGKCGSIRKKNKKVAILHACTQTRAPSAALGRASITHQGRRDLLGAEPDLS